MVLIFPAARNFKRAGGESTFGVVSAATPPGVRSLPIFRKELIGFSAFSITSMAVTRSNSRCQSCDAKSVVSKSI
jgi:hypothetical protein